MTSRLQWIRRYGNDIYTKKESHPFLWNDSPSTSNKIKTINIMEYQKFLGSITGIEPVPRPNRISACLTDTIYGATCN
jgi:hypothetical protein